MRDYKRIKRRIDISLERKQFLSLLGGLAVFNALLFCLGLVIGHGTATTEQARLDSLPLNISAAEENSQEADQLMVGVSNEEDNNSQNKNTIDPRKSQKKPEESKKGKRNPDKPRAVSANNHIYEHETIPAGHYAIQLSSFDNPEEAVAFASDLRKEYQLSPRIIRFQTKNKGIVYRVRIGDFTSRLEADLQKSQLGKIAKNAWIENVN